MRPILSPRARVRLRSPADVGSASCAEGTSVAATLLVFLRSLARGATATAVGAVVGWVVAFSSGPLVSPGSEKSRSEEHTSELQSLRHLVCRLLLEKNICRRVRTGSSHIGSLH